MSDAEKPKRVRSPKDVCSSSTTAGHNEQAYLVASEEILTEFRNLRKNLLDRMSSLETTLQEITFMSQEEAEIMRELSIQVNGFQEDLYTLRSEVKKVRKSAESVDPIKKKRPHSAADIARRKGELPEEMQVLEYRALRAELELRVVQAELDLRTTRADLELRSLRAEQELENARKEINAANRKGEAELEPDADYVCQTQLLYGYEKDVCKQDQWCGVDENYEEEAYFHAMRDVPPVLLLDMYQVHPLDILGQGGFSVVRRGVHTVTGECWAVKSYTEMESLDRESVDYEEAKQYYMKKFTHEVSIFVDIHKPLDLKKLIENDPRRIPKKSGSPGSNAKSSNKRTSWYIPDALTRQDSNNELMSVFDNFPPTEQLFVRIQDYSTELKLCPKTGVEKVVPGLAPDGVPYVVLEIGDFTLAEYLTERLYAGPPLSLLEIDQIFRQLASVVTALHAKNYVHADLKPMNVMHFPDGRWKLIDMDGMVRPGIVNAVDLCYTPLYCPPELCAQTLMNREFLDVSRHMDVWSLGVSIVELVLLKPMLDETLNAIGEIDDFLKWLCMPDVRIDVPAEVWNLSPDLADICQRMITKDTSARISMVEVMIHPWFVGESGASAVLERHVVKEVEAASFYLRKLVYTKACAKVALLERRMRRQSTLHTVTKELAPILQRKSMLKLVGDATDAGAVPAKTLLKRASTLLEGGDVATALLRRPSAGAKVAAGNATMINKGGRRFSAASKSSGEIT